MLEKWQKIMPVLLQNGKKLLNTLKVNMELVPYIVWCKADANATKSGLNRDYAI